MKERSFKRRKWIRKFCDGDGYGYGDGDGDGDGYGYGGYGGKRVKMNAE